MCFLVEGDEGILYAISKQWRNNFSKLIDNVSPTPAAAPDFVINSIQSFSVVNVNLRLNGEFDPNTSKVDAILMASEYEWTVDVLHALLSFARSEEYVGVLLPNEELRGRLSILGEEDDGDILPVMVVVILLQRRIQ